MVIYYVGSIKTWKKRVVTRTFEFILDRRKGKSSVRKIETKGLYFGTIKSLEVGTSFHTQGEERISVVFVKRVKRLRRLGFVSGIPEGVMRRI